MLRADGLVAGAEGRGMKLLSVAEMCGLPGPGTGAPAPEVDTRRYDDYLPSGPGDKPQPGATTETRP